MVDGLTELMMQTNKQLAAAQRRKLARISRELLAMGDEWEDVDNYLSSILHAAADQMAKLEKDIQIDNETTSFD